MNIHHITPGRSDLNFGKSINDIVEGLPEDDWICLRDIDTLPMNHRTFYKQCEAIAEDGSFDLVSCMTNRLGLTYQLHEGKLSNNFDLKHHLKIGEDLYKLHGNKVVESPDTVAGVMMLFSKRTWNDIGRIPEGGVALRNGFVDFVMCQKVKQIGGRIGIAKGIYLFHIYRHWAENVRMGHGHLFKK